MVHRLINFIRSAVAGSLMVAGAAVGSPNSVVDSAPQHFDWATPAARQALSQKGSAFLAGGQGTFVTRHAIPAANPGMPAQGVDPPIDPDAPMDLSSQFAYVFGGVPGPEATLPSGRKLFSACEPHNCVGTRAFVVTDDAGASVQSAGFLTVACALPVSAERPEGSLPGFCDTVPTLTVYYRGQPARQLVVAAEIIQWARLEVARSKQSSRLKIREVFLH